MYLVSSTISNTGIDIYEKYSPFPVQNLSKQKISDSRPYLISDSSVSCDALRDLVQCKSSAMKHSRRIKAKSSTENIKAGQPRPVALGRVITVRVGPTAFLRKTYGTRPIAHHDGTPPLSSTCFRTTVLCHRSSGPNVPATVAQGYGVVSTIRSAFLIFYH
ncbi:hypothetical protein T07_2499 [Trichinella nelsoni]|uniref:Uncharacterized protein n=1 Tax=Trichinella nelsoni TaxID=6336 RepID=A0A0V0RZZ2_9BILA|nr:hypothetical protein T07_2499 [Trichinella nelsoni]